MSKRAFLDELNRLLKSLPLEERREILYDYEEHIRVAMEHGKSEEQAVAGLGNVRLVAKSILAERLLDEAVDTRNPTNVLRAVFATFSLGVFNLFIVLGPFLGICISLFVLYIISIAFIGSPLLGMWFTFHGGGWSSVFAMCLAEGTGLLLLTASICISRFLWRWFVQYLKFNVRIARGGA